MITGIEWAIIGGFVTGVLSATFWDKIKAWASKMWNLIIDAINWTIEVASRALTYLIKKGSSFYKEVRVYVMNKQGQIRIETRRQETSRLEVPNDILRELDRKQELLVMQSKG